MKRRRDVRVAEPGIPKPERVGLSQIAAEMRALEPPRTSAHDTDEQCPCAICGGPCPPRSPHWGPWRRHPGCSSIAGDPIGRLQAASKALGHALERQDAALTPFSAPTYAEVHPEPTWAAEPLRERLPWRHLDRAALYAALERLPGLRIEAGLVDNRCTDGSCAWCGVLESRGWSSHGHVWADGTPAPLCGTCSEVYGRAGELDPLWWESQRAVLAEALTGVPVPIGTTPPTVRAYAEADKPRDRGYSGPNGDGPVPVNEHGTVPVNEGVHTPITEAEKGRARTFSEADGTPWSHLPADAVAAYRWTAWALYGGRYAPPEHRAEALQRARAAEDAWSARQAARLAAEAQRMDVFGFGGAA